MRSFIVGVSSRFLVALSVFMILSFVVAEVKANWVRGEYLTAHAESQLVQLVRQSTIEGEIRRLRASLSREMKTCSDISAVLYEGAVEVRQKLLVLYKLAREGVVAEGKRFMSNPVYLIEYSLEIANLPGEIQEENAIAEKYRRTMEVDDQHCIPGTAV